MRWAAFVVMLFVTLAAELSLRPVLTIRSMGGISPSFIAPLAVFVAMFAPRMTALWSCWLLGLLLDLSTPIVPGTGGSFYVLGPYALGYVFAGYLILQLRPVVFRQKVLTMAFLTFLSLVAVALITVAIFVLRGWAGGDPTIYPTSPSASQELFQRFGIAMYSAAVAIPVGWLMLATLPYWGFPTVAHRRTARR